MISSSAELEELIEATVTIPTIPTTLREIQRITQDPNGSAREAGELIERDPAIAAKVLRLVNSSFYALANPVSSIHLACSILGFKVIQNLVVQATVVDTFSGSQEIEGFDPSWLWDHSFKTALAARLLLKACDADFGLDAEEAYTCGLIHDVGKIILLESEAKRFQEAVAMSRDQRKPLAQAEGEVFGFSHAHVAGVLAKHWRLAPSLQEAVMYHHSPGTDPESWAKGFLVHAANTIAHEVAGEGGWIGSLASADSMQALGLSEEQLAEIRDEVARAGA